MKNSKFNKREIFKRAWQIIREDGSKKAEAFRIAWDEAKNPQGLAAKAKAFKEIQREIEHLNTQADALKNGIIAYMDGKSEVKTGDYTIRYQTITRNILDTKRLQAENKEIYNAYLKANESTRFTVTV